jgi:MarR family transcriptional regulator, transcriptional regulator for hemolysin
MSRETDKEQLLDEVSAFTRKLRAFFDARVGRAG